MVEYKKRKILFDPSTKQDKLIAGANIQITHTEGGDIISSSGGGEPIDMSAYLSKIEASSTYQEKGNYAYKSDIPSLVGYALKSEIPSLNGYAKLTDIPSLEGYAKTTDIPDISNLATKNEIPDISNLATKSEIPDITGKADKSTTYTKSEVDALIPEIPSLDNYAKKSDIPDVSNFATKGEIPDVSNLATNARVNEVENKIPSLIGYATESYVLNYHDSSKQDVGDYALRSELPIIPTNISAFTNDVDYVKRTDRPTTTKAGVICSGNWLKVNAETGKLECGELTVAQYQTVAGYTFISKTTLENVLSDKGYITSSYHDSTKQDVISDLSTIRSGAELGSTSVQTNYGSSYNQIMNNARIYSSDICNPWIRGELGDDTYRFPHELQNGENYINIVGRGNASPSISGKATELRVEGETVALKSDIPSMDNYALKSEIPTIPTNVSAFNNDSGYLTQHQSIKTINGESIIGTGNIEIQGGGASIEVNYYDD